MTGSRMTAAHAVAIHLGEDVAEVKRSRRYQPTRCYCAVFTVGDDYLTATPTKRRAPKDGPERGGMNSFNWQPVPASVALAWGWRIWRHVEPTEDEA